MKTNEETIDLAEYETKKNDYGNVHYSYNFSFLRLVEMLNMDVGDLITLIKEKEK